MKRTSTLFVLLLFFGPMFLGVPVPISGLKYGPSTGLDMVDAYWSGANYNDRAGHSIDFIGDLNGDNYDDIVIGAPYAAGGSADTGIAYVFFGKSAGFSLSTSVDSASASFKGVISAESAGRCVAGVGDMNGDGYDELAITSWRLNGADYSGVYLLYGKATGWGTGTSLSVADAFFMSVGTGNLDNAVVAGAGDLNNDGYDDLVIGDPDNDDGASQGGKTYIVFGSPTKRSGTISLATADASFFGSQANEGSGKAVASTGDVNGDGIDDLLIGAPGNSSKGTDAGAVYLILGKEKGWEKEVPLSKANTTFTGEGANDEAGAAIDGAGDVNGDGIADILIGAPYFGSTMTESGRTYIIFGKESWIKLVNLGTADVKITGEQDRGHFGFSVAGAGDANGDGWDDIFIGAPDENSMTGTDDGASHLFMGMPDNKWGGVSSSSNANCSFIGVSDYDRSSMTIAGNGDINGDGFPDLLVGAPERNVPSKGGQTGEVYLVRPRDNFASMICASAVSTFDDDDYATEETDYGLYEPVYIEVQEEDMFTSPADFDVILVIAVNQNDTDVKLRLPLRETGPNTKLYRGVFYTGHSTSRGHARLKAEPGDMIDIHLNHTALVRKTINILAPPPEIFPKQDQKTAMEDEEYRVKYTAVGPGTWTFSTNSSWLEWDEANTTLRGTPDNSHVGAWSVELKYGSGPSFDQHVFEVAIQNRDPAIVPVPDDEIMQYDNYSMDLDADDEMVGETVWSLSSNASWLSLVNDTEGVISGRPGQDDLGVFRVNMTFLDGNGGRADLEYNITVLNVNDRPDITTVPPTTVLEDQLYTVQFEATDPDADTVLSWTNDKPASWLNFETSSGLMNGTPRNEHVGLHNLSVTVSDGTLTDTIIWELEIINVNDAPEWTNVPVDSETYFGQLYTFDIDAVDVDVGDVVSFDIDTTPSSDMIINASSGIIEWDPMVEDRFEVDVSATDGNATVHHFFNLSVVLDPSNNAPTATLTAPANGSTIGTIVPTLEWSGTDDDDDGLYYNVYLSTTQALVRDLDPTVQIEDLTNETFHEVTGVDWDNTYYWTVVPFDGKAFGDCLDGVFSFTPVEGATENHPPRITGLGSQSVKVGELFEVYVTAEDDDVGDVLTFSLDEKPVGLKIDASTGRVYWTPTRDQEGDHDVVVVVSDGTASVNASFTISVLPAGGGDEVTLMDNILVWLLVIGLLVAIAIVVVVYNRRKDQGQLVGVPEPVETEPEPGPVRVDTPVAAAVSTPAPGPAPTVAAGTRDDGVEDFEVDAVLLITSDGRLISSEMGADSTMDKDILSGMLTAIGSFVRESFDDDSGLNSFETGGRQIVLVKGQYTYITVVLRGREPPGLRDKMQRIIERFEGEYAGIVDSWDGDTGHFTGLDKVFLPILDFKEGLKIKELVKVKSGIEFYQGYVRLKVGVENKTKRTIADAKLFIEFDTEALRLAKVEPDDLRHEGAVVQMGNIRKSGKKTAAFYLDPMICQESVIDGHLTYYDFEDQKHHVDMKRRPVDVVCPIFYTKETVNIAMLKRLVNELKNTDVRHFRITNPGRIRWVLGEASAEVQAHDVKPVRDYTEGEAGKGDYIGESWFYGQTKGTEDSLVIMVRVAECDMALEVMVATDNLATQTGLLAELGSKIHDRCGLAVEPLFKERDDIDDVLCKVDFLLNKYETGE